MRLNQAARRGEFLDVLIIVVILLVVGIVTCGIWFEITHRPKYRPINPVSVAPGQLVYYDRDPGIVIGVTQGTAESAPLVRVRFRANDRNGRAVYSEAEFLPGELQEKDISP